MASEKEAKAALSPAVDIPDLKKKDEERKKAGAFWSGSRAAASHVSGSATSVAGSSLARLFAGLTSTLLGKTVVAAAGLSLTAGAGFVGYSLVSRGFSGAVKATAGPSLGAIQDGLKVHTEGRNRISIEIKKEDRLGPAAETPKPAAPASEVKPNETPAAPAMAADAGVANLVAGMSQGLSPGRMSGGLSRNFGQGSGSGFGSGFGNQNLLADKKSMFKTPFGGGAKSGKEKGKLSGFKTAYTHASSTARHVTRSISGKAFTQLFNAQSLSYQAAQGATAEEAHASAQNAIDQQNTHGGDMNAIGISADGKVTPAGMGSGHGAGGQGSSGGGTKLQPPPGCPGCPPVQTPTATSPDSGLTEALSKVSQMADQGRSDFSKGTDAMILGGIILAVGIAAAVTMQPWAGFVMFLGSTTIGYGWLQKQAGIGEMSRAGQMGHELADKTGDQNQAKIIDHCIDDNAASGTPVESCVAPVESGQVQKAVQEAIQKVKNIPVDPKAKEVPVGNPADKTKASASQ